MDKAVLKKFAIESRMDLMQKMENKIKSFYVDEEFAKQQNGDLYVLSNNKHTLSLSKSEYDKRELLLKRIKELGIEQVIEESAYTWFNRIVAIRYMEINDYLPLTKNNNSLGVRVLSSKDNTPDPEIMKFSNLINPELDIEFNKEKYISLNDDNEKFKYILLKVCKKLGQVIPQVFDGVTDYIDLLIPDNLLNDTGFVNKIITDLPEENFSDVEIIGWLYQYYNQLEKDKVISAKKMYKKNEIPYATQLFTPDWIVKYMVENSLGKYWVEHTRNNEKLIKNWKYFINENLANENDMIDLTKLTFIDPCCGSGHILVYAYEVFFQLYENLGYEKSKISELILKNNIYGLDIDDRAGQLSVLSIILKAREYDKNIFNKDIIKNINIKSIQEYKDEYVLYLDELSDNSKQIILELVEKFKNAKEIGSLLKLNNMDYDSAINEINSCTSIFSLVLKDKIIPLLEQAKILSRNYTIVVTNPPYLNNSVMSTNMREYMNSNYKDFKSDLFSAFIQRNYEFGTNDSYYGFMTPYVWMFISTYEKLRRYILNNIGISSLIQLEYSALEEATVPICTFVLGNSKCGSYFRLTDYSGGMKVQENKYLNSLKTREDYYEKNIKDFNRIPGVPIAYWASENILNDFEKSESISDFANIKIGMGTGKNDLFLRNWWEVPITEIEFNNKSINDINEKSKKYYPYNKGGDFRLWYGNQQYVLWYDLKGQEEMNKISGHRENGGKPFYCKSGLTWSFISSSRFGIRFIPEGFFFDVAGSTMFIDDEKLKYYILGMLSSKVCFNILKFLNPTLNYQAGNIANIPLIIKNEEEVNEIVKENIDISKTDWDSFENSWNFKRHPLINKESNLIKDAYLKWENECNSRFLKLKTNEEKINSIFIANYNLNDEISPYQSDSDVTIRKANVLREVKSLISYAVGCMFGRYSLDQDGLIYAGGQLNENYCFSFKIDEDNIIPITDEAYFGDDIVSKFKNFIEILYSKETLNENIDFVAEVLGKKGTETSEEAIRRYFLNDFYADHIKMYQKKPIYWLFDSGKKNGFKALIYMHRYNENTVPKIRLDYLHRIQTTYEKLLTDINYKLTTDLSMTDKKEAQKRQVDLNNKLTEIKEYDEKIAHIANQRINIDLDDGVTVNYAKFADILAKIK